MDLAEFANQMSEILIGYREGSEEEMLSRAKCLVELEKQHNRQKNVAELFEAIKGLQDRAEEIESGFI